VHVNRTTNNPIVVYEDQQAGGIVRKEVDLVVLASGLEPSDGTGKIAEMLGLRRDSYGFLSERHPTDGMAETRREGIFIAGVCQGPKDIPDAATHGSAAACKVGAFLSGGRSSLMSEMETAKPVGLERTVKRGGEPGEISYGDSHG